MKICFDLDNTLCHGYPYEDAKPFPKAAEMLQRLKALGHTIVIYTARGMKSRGGDVGRIMAEIAPLTFRQLDEWGFPYDAAYFGKPDCDIFLDDKASNMISYDQVFDLVGRMSLASEPLTGSCCE